MGVALFPFVWVAVVKWVSHVPPLEVDLLGLNLLEQRTEQEVGSLWKPHMGISPPPTPPPLLILLLSLILQHLLL